MAQVGTRTTALKRYVERLFLAYSVEELGFAFELAGVTGAELAARRCRGCWRSELLGATALQAGIAAVLCDPSNNRFAILRKF